MDVAAGDFTAVIIFMIGSIFSPRYSSALKRGAGPRQHAAVNFALYERGIRRHWVLSEYQRVEADHRTLRIGRSSMHLTPGGKLVVDLVDSTALWGRPVEVHVELTREGPGHEPIRLVKDLEHWWHLIAPRARATLSMRGLELEGRGYHDGNHGEVPLGSDLRGWNWVRTHAADRTTITYRPSDSGTAWQVEVDARSLALRQLPASRLPFDRTKWGLAVPKILSGKLLESSPFYARLEAGSALAEVADFQRFHSPWIRWMAGLRTRVIP